MWKGDVTLIEPLARPSLVCRDTHDIFAAWAKKHHAITLEWTSDQDIVSDQETLWSRDIGNIRLRDCTVSPEEFDEKGILHIGPFRAYMSDGIYIPGREEEAPSDFASAFKKFVLDFFETANIPAEMQESIWNMSLRSFCTTWENVSNQSAPAHQEDINLSRRQLLTNIKNVICPRCGHKGFLRIMDGMVSCDLCGTTYGDIDNIPD